MKLPDLIVGAVGIALAAGAAHAEPDALRQAAFRNPPSDAATPPPRSEPPRDFAMPRTAVERSFGEGEMTGSAGFLCGIQPKAVTDGAASAYGVDPHGRFLGLQLRMTLR